ncbi:HPr family phosphocarrier protein [Fictibacillus sp. KIGAM418]|uniref:HPr family phosphocarrier protein n=1 Tax=Fictibacillus marinisediminis TaxID=2878389 RepID=A0A9X1XDS5_9BACL|nr:HPr family phosphocarrier protein [Fictibacillus marinisediminis]MCK6257603.1 HPr family phosphocarrier protein [Fictibacillus marinisediminis]
MKKICSKTVSITSDASKFTIQKVTDFVKISRSFQSNVFLCKNGVTLHAKKLTCLVTFFMMLRKGESFLLITEGADADSAIQQLLHQLLPSKATT